MRRRGLLLENTRHPADGPCGFMCLSEEWGVELRPGWAAPEFMVSGGQSHWTLNRLPPGKGASPAASQA